MQKAVAFFDKWEANMKNGDLLATANQRIQDLEKQVAAKEGEAGTANTELEKVRGQLTAKDGEIAQLQETIKQKQALLDDPKSAANIKAVQIAQSQGVPPIKEEKTAGGQAAGMTALEQYNSIKDPKEKALFYSKNRAAIFGNNTSN